MDHFHESLIEQSRDLLDRIQEHPFMRQVAAATVTEERFRRWLCQDYYWILQFTHFISRLAAQAPAPYRRKIIEALLAIHGNIEVFENLAKGAKLDLTAHPVGRAHHASAHHLLATAYVHSFEEVLSACYATSLSHLTLWSRVKETQSAPSPWQDIIDHRTAEDFTRWVETLAGFSDTAVENATPETRRLMRESFRMTLQYDLACWDDAVGQLGW